MEDRGRTWTPPPWRPPTRQPQLCTSSRRCCLVALARARPAIVEARREEARGLQACRVVDGVARRRPVKGSVRQDELEAARDDAAVGARHRRKM